MDQFWRMHDLRMLHSIYNQHEDRWWPGQLDCRLQSDIKYNLKHIFNKAFYNFTLLQITTRQSRLTLADAAWSHPSNSLDNDFPLLVYQLPACVARRVVISLFSRWLLVLSRNIGMKSSLYCIHDRGLELLESLLHIPSFNLKTYPPLNWLDFGVANKKCCHWLLTKEGAFWWNLEDNRTTKITMWLQIQTVPATTPP